MPDEGEGLVETFEESWSSIVLVILRALKSRFRFAGALFLRSPKALLYCICCAEIVLLFTSFA